MTKSTLSIVTSYHNRRNSFINTLRSISKSKYSKDIEVIVVDNGRRSSHNDWHKL